MRPVIILLALSTLLLAACSTPAAGSAENLPPGDAVNGAALFSQSVGGAPACSTCHTTDGTSLVGPSFEGFAERAPQRVSSLSAEEYAHQSIVQPSAFVVSGFGNVMYNQYAQRLSSDQIADLIAYLLTL